MKTSFDERQPQETIWEPDRRLFLRRALSGGSGFMLMNGLASSASAGVVETSFKASAADSLFQYLDLLSDVQDYAVSEGFKVVRAETTILLMKLRQLNELVDKLKLQLADSPKTASVNEMRDLAEMGRSSIRLIRASSGISAEKTRALLSTFAVASQQVAKKAEDLLPTGAAKALSRDAADTLRKIIDLVDSIRDPQVRVEKAQEDYRNKLQAWSAQRRAFRDQLLQVTTIIVNADNSTSPSEAVSLREEAINKIESVIRELEGFQKKSTEAAPKQSTPADARAHRGTEKKASGEGSKLPPAILLVRLLRGVQEVTRHPEKLTLAFNTRAEERGKIVPVSYFSGSPRVEPAVSFAELVGSHCPPASSWRLWGLGLLAGPIWALYHTVEERKPLMECVLKKFSCQNPSSLSQLAQALAEFSL